MSVSQMVDIGHGTTFNSKGCKIRKEGSRKLLAREIMTLDNAYVLKGGK